MTDLALTLQLVGSELQNPPAPGGQALEGNSVLLQGQAPTPVINDLLQDASTAQQDDSPTQTVTWSFSRSADAGAWAATTYPVAMVFQMILAASSGTAPSGTMTPGFKPSSIFKIPESSGLILSCHTWASGSGSVLGTDRRTYVPGTAFTYLIPPYPGAAPVTGDGSTYSWSLEVEWGQVHGSGLAVSYPTASRKALALKYRLYCYSTTFGLWYIDPELDLCPQQGGG